MLTNIRIMILQEAGLDGLTELGLSRLCDQARRANELAEEVERMQYRCDSLDLDRAAAVVALEGICESPMVVSGQPREFLAALDKGRTVWRRCVEKDAALLRERE